VPGDSPESQFVCGHLGAVSEFKNLNFPRRRWIAARWNSFVNCPCLPQAGSRQTPDSILPSMAFSYHSLNLES
jgi:hypothetical protein